MKQEREAVGFHRADGQPHECGPANDLLGLARKKDLQCNSVVGRVKRWSKKKMYGPGDGLGRIAMILLDQWPTRDGL
jgi:hypothetical protein